MTPEQFVAKWKDSALGERQAAQSNPLVSPTQLYGMEINPYAHELRENWLNAPGLTEQEAKKRTLTNLYNENPTWLTNAHQKLDQAVLKAYGWQDIDAASLSPTPRPGETNQQATERAKAAEEEMLKRLLALNLEREALGTQGRS